MDMNGLFDKHELIADGYACPDRCDKLLLLWKCIMKSKEQLLSYPFSKWSLRFEAVLVSLNAHACPSIEQSLQNCCEAERNILLLVLSLIQLWLDQTKSLNSTEVFTRSCEVAAECRNENKRRHNVDQYTSFEEKNGKIMESSILFSLKLATSSDDFIAHHSLKVFSEFFYLYPKSLDLHLEIIKETFFCLLRMKTIVFYGSVLKLVKFMRREMKVVFVQPDSTSLKSFFARMRVITVILQVLGFATEPKRSDMPCSEEDNNLEVELINRLKVLHQAKKLAILSSQGIKDIQMQANKFGTVQLENGIEKLLLGLNQIMENFEQHLERLISPVKLNSFEYFLKLKILLQSLDHLNSESIEVIDLAQGVIQQVLCMDLGSFEFKYFKRLHGFGGSLFVGNKVCEESNVSSNTEGYSCLAYSCMRMLLLVVLKSMLACIETEESDCLPIFGVAVSGTKDTCRLLEHMALMLCYANQQESKQLSLKEFSKLLVNVMVDEDDQLCRAVLYLLKILRSLANDNSITRGIPECNCAQESAGHVLPHELFYSLLEVLSFDHMVCIDWLICDETCFLELLLLYLEIVVSNFKSFKTCFEDSNTIEMYLKNSTGINRTFLNDVCLKSDDTAFRYGVVIEPSGKEERPSQKQVKQNVIHAPVERFCGSLQNGRIWENCKCVGAAVDGETVPENQCTPFLSECETKLKTACDVGPRQVLSEEVGVEHRETEGRGLVSLVNYDSSDSEEGSFYLVEDRESVDLATDQSAKDPGEVVREIDRVCCGNLEESELGNKGNDEFIMPIINKCGDKRTGKRLENIMDFFVRLRLKLERISGNMLSVKNFDNVIDLLAAVEDLYDAEDV